MKAASLKDQRRLYSDLAWTWPIISPPEHYVEEAREFCEAIRRNAQIEAKSLLDLGCGGGHNDYTLKNEFEVTGVDISANMLALARRLNPEITFIENTYDPDPADTTFESTFVYLIRREGQLDIETDHHLCGIFPLETWRNLLTGVGFEVKQVDFKEGNCPLFVCLKLECAPMGKQAS